MDNQKNKIKKKNLNHSNKTKKKNIYFEGLSYNPTVIKGIPITKATKVIPEATEVIPEATEVIPEATEVIPEATEAFPITKATTEAKDTTQTEEYNCMDDTIEPEVGKLSLKVFPYDVDDGVNSKKYRIADYRINVNHKPYSVVDQVNNLLKNLIRFEKKEGSFKPIYEVDGNDRELWYKTGFSKEDKGVVNPLENNAKLLQDPRLKDMKEILDERNINDDIETQQIEALKELGWERRIISIDKFAREKIMVNKDIEIDLIPEIVLPESAAASQGGGSRKQRKNHKKYRKTRKNKKIHSPKLLTLHFKIILKKKKNVPFRINRRFVHSTPLEIPKHILLNMTRKNKQPYQEHK